MPTKAAAAQKKAEEARGEAAKEAKAEAAAAAQKRAEAEKRAEAAAEAAKAAGAKKKAEQASRKAATAEASSGKPAAKAAEAAQLTPLGEETPPEWPEGPEAGSPTRPDYWLTQGKVFRCRGQALSTDFVTNIGIIIMTC